MMVSTVQSDQMETQVLPGHRAQPEKADPQVDQDETVRMEPVDDTEMQELLEHMVLLANLDLMESPEKSA